MMCVRRQAIATQRRISLTSRPCAQTLITIAPQPVTFARGSLNMPYAAKSLHALQLGVASIALSVLPFSSSAWAYESASGPRVRGLGVVSAPVDRRGPTLRPDPLITPDSGWMGSGTGGAVSSGRSGLPSLVPPPPQPIPVVAPTVQSATSGSGTAKKAKKARGRIILQKPNG